MPGSVIAVASGSIDSLTVGHAFILTPQLMQATGSNSQADAAPITTPAAVVVTVSTSSRGVRLPAAVSGLTEMIHNTAGTFVRVFPASNDRIGANATNESIGLEPGKGGIFFAQDTTTWRVILGA
jgi:hypothetical protein